MQKRSDWRVRARVDVLYLEKTCNSASILRQHKQLELEPRQLLNEQKKHEEPRNPTTLCVVTQLRWIDCIEEVSNKIGSSRVSNKAPSRRNSVRNQIKTSWGSFPTVSKPFLQSKVTLPYVALGRRWISADGFLSCTKCEASEATTEIGDNSTNNAPPRGQLRDVAQYATTSASPPEQMIT